MVDLVVPDDVEAAHDREWVRLAAPGTWLTGAERVGVAAAARGDGGADLPEAMLDAARRIHDEPATVTEDWVIGLEAGGLSRLAYVEVLGIIARLRALDTFTFGLGRPRRPLPEALDGQPRRATVDGADHDGGWVPTVGPAGPVNACSAVPAEHDANHDLHGHLYLEPRGGDGNTMGNFQVVRDGLDRSQIEFVAARTSLLNDCFF